MRYGKPNNGVLTLLLLTLISSIMWRRVTAMLTINGISRMPTLFQYDIDAKRDVSQQLL